jgi:hypothetical protein
MSFILGMGAAALCVGLGYYLRMNIQVVEHVTPHEDELDTDYTVNGTEDGVQIIVPNVIKEAFDRGEIKSFGDIV